jgi:hypothetical protein
LHVVTTSTAAKADQILQVATSALESEPYGATLLNAIHAAIRGADGVAREVVVKARL